MTVSIPFDRKPSRSRSVVIPDDLLDAIDLIRIGANEDAPLSRSAAICHLLTFAIALHIDEHAVADFVAFQMT